MGKLISQKARHESILWCVEKSEKLVADLSVRKKVHIHQYQAESGASLLSPPVAALFAQKVQEYRKEAVQNSTKSPFPVQPHT